MHAFYYQTLNKRATNDNSDIAQALDLAKHSLSILDAFEWPAYSDREGDCIAEAIRSLTAIIKELTPRSPGQEEA